MKYLEFMIAYCLFAGGIYFARCVLSFEDTVLVGIALILANIFLKEKP